MSNVVKFKINGLSSALSNAYARVTDLSRVELFEGETLVSDALGNVELDIGTAGTDGQGVIVYGDNYSTGNELTFKSFTGYGLVESGANTAAYYFDSQGIAPNYRLNTTSVTDGSVQTYHVTQITVAKPRWSANNVRIAFQHGWTGSSGEATPEGVPPTNIIVQAALFDGNTKLADINVSTLSSFTMTPQQVVWSDAIDASLIINAVNPTIRCYSELPVGGTRAGRRSNNNIDTRVYATSSQATALAAMVDGSAMPNGNSGFPNTYAFNAVAMAYDNRTGIRTVLVTGDSIAAGNDNALGNSWITDALNNVAGGYVSYCNFAIHGTKPSNQDTAIKYGTRLSIVDQLKTINGGVLPFDSIISEIGVNDASGTNGPSLQAKMQTYLDFIASEWAGVPIIQTTYTPRVTNNTTYIQTDASVMAAATLTPANADRWFVADWIKTNPTPITNHIDVREAWTGSVSGTEWRVIPYSSTLSASANIGQNFIDVLAEPPLGIVPVLNAGTLSLVESTQIPITAVVDQGGGVWRVSLGKNLTKAHAAGSTIKATMSVDALHPEEGYASDYARDVVIANKSIL